MGWESSTRRGGGRKVRARPRKFVFLGFRLVESGGNFAGMSRTPEIVQEVCAEKVRAHFSLPTRGGGLMFKTLEKTTPVFDHTAAT